MQTLNNLLSGGPKTPGLLGPRVTEVKARDRERLFFFMGMMLRSGNTTVEACRAVGKAFQSEKKEDISEAMHAIAAKVAQGKSLSKAMEMEPKLFTDIHRAAVMAGEASNQMEQAFQILRQLEDKKIQSGRAGMAEILTPMALLLLSFASLFNTGLNTLPVMVKLREAQGKPVGIVPQMIMDFTGVMADNWYIILTIFVIGIVILFSLVRSRDGKLWVDQFMLDMPILGKFITYKTYSSMLLYFPHLIASGVQPKQMIPIMEALSTNLVLKQKIDGFNAVITSGGQMSEAMKKAGFPDIVVTPVSVAENYTSSDEGINDVMIEGMHHAYGILERMLNDANTRFVSVTSSSFWVLGGGVMLLDMLSIVLTQS